MSAKYLLNPVNVGSNRHQPGSVITDAQVQAEVAAAGGLLVDATPEVVRAAAEAQAAVKRGDLTAALGYMASVAGGGGGKAERVVASDSGNDYTLSRTGVSVVLNQTGVGFFSRVFLPDGVDGDVKEIVCGENGQDSPSPVAVRCTNNLGNDAYDLPIGAAVRFVWMTASGGWVATNYCPNANANWD